jgi:hypothetical protein
VNGHSAWLPVERHHLDAALGDDLLALWVLHDESADDDADAENELALRPSATTTSTTSTAKATAETARHACVGRR